MQYIIDIIVMIFGQFLVFFFVFGIVIFGGGVFIIGIFMVVVVVGIFLLSLFFGCVVQYCWYGCGIVCVVEVYGVVILLFGLVFLVGVFLILVSEKDLNIGLIVVVCIVFVFFGVFDNVSFIYCNMMMQVVVFDVMCGCL